MQSTLFGVGSIILGVAGSILGMILSVIPFLGWMISLLLTLVLAIGLFGLWIYLMAQAFQGREWELPIIGEHARRLATFAQPTSRRSAGHQNGECS